MLPFRTIREVKNLKGKRVLLELDLNEPIQDGVVQNDFRIRRSIPTIEYLKKKGARIIVVSHRSEKGVSMAPIARHLNRFTRVGFVPDIVGTKACSAVESLSEGGAILLQNLRLNNGEEKNSPAFAKKLSSLADIFVNDAFSNSHRPHASIVGVPKYIPSYAGFLFVEEYRNLSRARKPKKPFLFILGGVKFETKMPLIKRYLPLAKNIFIGGGSGNMLLKLAGYELGRSVVGEFVPGLKPLLANKKIILPLDLLLLSGKTITPAQMTRKDKIVDIGARTIDNLKKHISGAGSILFNGPVGISDDGFSHGTEEILKMMSRSKAESVVGGGDTVALLSKLKLENKFAFVSTAGGAMLEFLVKGTLPGIKALERKM